ncbi:MAG: ABC transporter ATP-binding protein, partial [Bryobacteraceae bacterium]
NPRGGLRASIQRRHCAMIDEAPVLEGRGLTKRYSALTAVRDVNFAISPRQVLGVLGPNGSGKSTIVKMVTGLLEPSQGTILFQGRPIGDDLSGYKRALGYVPEQPELYGYLTGWEYLEMVATLRGLDRRLFREKAAVMLEGFTLYPSRDMAISSYSKGMRQRIVVIAALLHNPEILILDEPFSGLDVTSALVLRRVVELLAERGKAVLFSSPVMEQVDRLCTHLVMLKRGSVVAAGSIGEIHESLVGLDLEAGLMQLTEHVDAGHNAESIAAAATTVG